MNVTKVRRLLVAAMVTLALTSCGPKEEYIWSKFERVEFKTDGIKLLTGHYDPMTYVADMLPPKGVTFSLTGTGKLADEAYVSHVVIESDSEWTQIESIPPKSGVRPTEEIVPRWEGEWGTIEYTSPSEPYTIKVTINENLTDNVRGFHIYFSGAYYSTHIRLEQAAAEGNEEGLQK